MYAIEITNITKTFGKHKAVDELSLTVPEGSIYGFIGPNGSGKTTTIRMIMNILYPDSGTVRIFGGEHIGSRLDDVGYLPEERGLYKKMKVKEILNFHAELKNGQKIKQEIDYWLKRFDLEKWADKKVETLSKGMSQKVQFIATIIDRPKIIILDEPFSGLDPINADIIKSTILELQAEGSTVIFSTHDMSMAERMCDYIFMIHKGKKVLDGTLTDIQDKYGTDTLRIQTDNGVSAFKDIPGIEKINDFGQMQEIRIVQSIDVQDMVRSIMDKTRVTRFEITKPSLNDIFIRIAKPEKEEVDHA